MMWGLLILLAVAWAVLVLIGTVIIVYVVTHPPRRTEGVAIARGEPTTPAEAGAPRYQTRRMKLADGHELELWDVTGNRPDGPVVVMLHGWGDGRLGELLWLEVLAPLASRLILFDLRAHGACAHRRCAWGALEVDDALAVIEECGVWNAECGMGEQSGPQRPVVLFGYSMGAAIAILAAERAGEKVAGVIADSPYRSIAQAVGGTMRSNRLPRWPMVPLAMAWLKLRGAVPYPDDLSQAVRRLTAPLLVLHGEDDRVAPLGDARHIADAAPRGRLVVFAGCDHLQAGCAAPQQYAQAIEQWVCDLNIQHSTFNTQHPVSRSSTSG